MQGRATYIRVGGYHGLAKGSRGDRVGKGVLNEVGGYIGKPRVSELRNTVGSPKDPRWT